MCHSENRNGKINAASVEYTPKKSGPEADRRERLASGGQGPQGNRLSLSATARHTASFASFYLFFAEGIARKERSKRQAHSSSAQRTGACTLRFREKKGSLNPGRLPLRPSPCR